MMSFNQNAINNNTPNNKMQVYFHTNGQIHDLFNEKLVNVENLLTTRPRQ